jgi:hypothetical protein
MVFRGALLAVVLLISAAALFMLLPWLKEGYDLGDLPRFAAMAAGLALVSWLWWRSSRGAVRMAGVAALAVPLLVYTGLSGTLVFNQWYGHRLEGRTHITAFQATPIVWAGFAGPVGVRVEMEVTHPAGLDVALLFPKIARTSEPELTAQQYFSLFSTIQHAYLSVPLFPVRRESPRNVFQDSPTKLVYELFPSNVYQLEESRRLCLWKDAGRAQAAGPNLGGSWFFITKGGANVDLSRELSEAVRGNDWFRNMTEDQWTAMFERVSPEGLMRSDYQLCPSSSQDTFQSCYCR